MVIGPARSSRTPHVIVVGSEKGGSGKTTIAIHIALALLKASHRVATIDLDARQQSLTHFLENRRVWAWREHLTLESPTHICVAPQARSRLVADNERAAFTVFEQALNTIDDRHAFVVIDTPSHDDHLTRLAHAMSDTLVTPLNDSFLDLDALAKLDAISLEVTGRRTYAEMVRKARRERHRLDSVLSDWLVVRNRLPPFGTRPSRPTARAFDHLSQAFACRIADGLHECAIYRDLFPLGLTALDEATQLASGGGDVGGRARRDVQGLLAALRLPINAAVQSVTAEPAGPSQPRQEVTTPTELEPRHTETAEDGGRRGAAYAGAHLLKTQLGLGRSDREPPATGGSLRGSPRDQRGGVGIRPARG
jgi:chromosome partitioning protein